MMRACEKKRMERNRSDQEGVILILMVFIVAMSTLFVGALLRSHTSDLQITRNHLNSMKALFVADAGIEDAISELRADFTWNAGFTDQIFPSGDSSKYTVSVVNNHPLVVITSTGEANGFIRNIEVELNIVESTAPYPVRVIYWKEV